MLEFDPFDHPVCLTIPGRITHISFWHEHIPFAMLLVDLMKPETVVELGTNYGDSYCAFCQAVKYLKLQTRCFAVDTWKGGPQASFYGSDVLAELHDYHDPLYGSFSRLIQSSFDEALLYFEDGTIDLLHIDGYHTYESVKHDLESWIPKLSSKGIILVHDINIRERSYGVWKLWDEIKVRYSHFQFLHSQGLGILAIGKTDSRELQSLFDADTENTARIRDLFFQLGHRLTFKLELEGKEREIQEQKKDSLTKSLRIRELEASLKEKESQLVQSRALMQQSIVMRTQAKYQKVIEIILRNGSRRRRLYELMLSGLRVILFEGWRSLWNKAKQELKNRSNLHFPNTFYRDWVTQVEPDQEVLDRQKQESLFFIYRPKISILTPVWNPEAKWLRSAIESVINQTYNNWELCLADGGSTKSHIRELLREFAKQDSRIKVNYLSENKGISGNSNESLYLATGEFIGLLDHDDELAPSALFEIVKLLNDQPEADFIYSDEDKISIKGERFSPFFKPDWSPDLLNTYMYTGHLTVYKRSLVEECGKFRSEYDFSQDYDLALRISEKAKSIMHIPKVLYHWKAVNGSAASGGKAFARESNIASLQSAVERRGYNGKAVIAPPPYYINRIKYKLTTFPLISIIIPTDNKENIVHCVESVLAKTSYSGFEIIIVTNSYLAQVVKQLFSYESRVKICEFNQSFSFSAKCNLGADMAKGEYLLFLNDDMGVRTDNWLEEMVELFQRPEIGAVAPKLIYPDNTVQHAGLVTGVRGFVGTAFHCRPWDSVEYFYFIQCPREVSALSAACLMVRCELFRSLDGFDYINTPIMHSDVDLCFRIREKGYILVYTPFAALDHIGHVSLGKIAKPAKSDGADLYLLKKWPKYISYDPYYTPNMRNMLYEDTSPYKLIVNNSEYMGNSKGNILLVSHDLSLSGAPIVLYNIAAYLHKKNFFITVISPIEGELAEKFKEMGIPVIIDASILNSPMSETVKVMANFDLIIANTILTWQSVFVGKETGVPVIWMVHESEFGKELAKNNERIGRALEIADAVIFEAKYVADLYHEFNKVDNFRVIYYGIDVANPDKDKIVKSKLLRVLCAGTIEPRKGQDILLRCISVLHNDILDNCEFLFIGRVFPQTQNFYEQLLVSAKQLKNVRFVNQVAYDTLIEHYSNTDIYVCASRDEGVPLTILEAMSQGKAVIASNVGGIHEIIEDGKDGILVPKEDVDSLADALTLLFKNAELREYLGKNAARKIAESFTLEKWGDRFLPLITQMIAERKGK